MSVGSLSRRYAKALMGIGVEEQNFEQIASAVRELATAMKDSAEMSEALSNPAFSGADRRKVLEAVLAGLGAPPIVKNFTLLLLERDRLEFFPHISKALDIMVDDRMARANATVQSATPLSPAQEAKLKSQLEALSGRTISLRVEHDPSLIGGVIAKVGDTVYDGSLRTQLNQIREEIAHGAN